MLQGSTAKALFTIPLRIPHTAYGSIEKLSLAAELLLLLLMTMDMLQGSTAEGASYSPTEETLQTFWQHCENILGRTAVELPEPSLDADTQEQHLAHAKLEQVEMSSPCVLCLPPYIQLLQSFREAGSFKSIMMVLHSLSQALLLGVVFDYTMLVCLDADTQEQHQVHAKLEQVQTPLLLLATGSSTAFLRQVNILNAVLT